MRRARRSLEGPGVAMRDVLLVEWVDGDGVGEEEEGAQQEQVVCPVLGMPAIETIVAISSHTI